LGAADGFALLDAFEALGLTFLEGAAEPVWDQNRAATTRQFPIQRIIAVTR
jgi:hypothetical protein